MVVNPKLLELIDEHFHTVEDKDCALTYCLCVELGTIITLYKWGVFKNEANESKFRILFVNEDPEAIGSQRKYKLKIPLFVTDVDKSLYSKYYKELIKNPKLTPFKTKLVNRAEGKQAFEELVDMYDEFDLKHFLDATVDYYTTAGQYATALPKFLQEAAMAAYESFKKEKSNLL